MDQSRGPGDGARGVADEIAGHGLSQDGLPEGFVRIGTVVGPFGVRGWVRVKPLTAAPETILDFPSWAVVVHDEAVGFSAVDARVHGRDIVARLDGVETREQAERLRGGAVGVRRNQLPPLAPGEYYWADLEGMDVFHIAGARLGYVAGFIETGANDVMIVQGERERLIPYLPDVVQRVDTTTRRIDVDWDPDF